MTASDYEQLMIEWPLCEPPCDKWAVFGETKCPEHLQDEELSE